LTPKLKKAPLMQYLLNIAQFPRLETPPPPLLVDAPDEAAILLKANELIQRTRDGGAQKVQVQVRRAANLTMVALLGDT
jgi:hypothetical protein